MAACSTFLTLRGLGRLLPLTCLLMSCAAETSTPVAVWTLVPAEQALPQVASAKLAVNSLGAAAHVRPALESDLLASERFALFSDHADAIFELTVDDSTSTANVAADVMAQNGNMKRYTRTVTQNFRSRLTVTAATSRTTLATVEVLRRLDTVCGVVVVPHEGLLPTSLQESLFPPIHSCDMSMVSAMSARALTHALVPHLEQHSLPFFTQGLPHADAAARLALADDWAGAHKQVQADELHVQQLPHRPADLVQRAAYNMALVQLALGTLAPTSPLLNKLGELHAEEPVKLLRTAVAHADQGKAQLATLNGYVPRRLPRL